MQFILTLLELVVGQQRLAERLILTPRYAHDSIECFQSLNSEMIKQLDIKYSKYTRIASLRKLWDFIFFDPAYTKFEDYWELDEEKDQVLAWKTGPTEKRLSSSEKIFLGLWRACFSGKTEYIEYFALGHLDNNSFEKLHFFLSVARQFGLS